MTTVPGGRLGTARARARGADLQALMQVAGQAARSVGVGSDLFLDRRAFLARGAVLGATAVGASPALARAPRIGRRRSIPLPGPQQVRDDFTRMVEFGPRLTASPEHERYIAWLEDAFERAGLSVADCDGYTTQRWLAEDWGSRAAEGGEDRHVLPALAAHAAGRRQRTPGLRWHRAFAQRHRNRPAGAQGRDRALSVRARVVGPRGRRDDQGGAQGSILLVDLPMPVPFTAAAFLPIATYLNWPGHTTADWAQIDYKRAWIEPGLGVRSRPSRSSGSGVVFICDSSFEALEGVTSHSPTALNRCRRCMWTVRRARRLRRRAFARPGARLKLTASLEGSHTGDHRTARIQPGDDDLQHAHRRAGVRRGERRGGVHAAGEVFASLAPERGCGARSSSPAWPGHIGGRPAPDAGLDRQPSRPGQAAAAALTVEHLGLYRVGSTRSTTAITPRARPSCSGSGPPRADVRPHAGHVRAHRIPAPPSCARRPSSASARRSSPRASLRSARSRARSTCSRSRPSGELDKLDARLASRQIAWLADLATRFDGVPAAELRRGDPTLGVGGLERRRRRRTSPAATAPRVRLSLALTWRVGWGMHDRAASTCAAARQAREERILMIGVDVLRHLGEVRDGAACVLCVD